MPFSYLFAGFLSALDIPKYTLYTVEMGMVVSEKSSSMLEYILFVLRQISLFLTSSLLILYTGCPSSDHLSLLIRILSYFVVVVGVKLHVACPTQ